MQQAEIITPEPGMVIEFALCPRCKGQGYHHGFGEHGHDPDWCTRCDGPGYESRELLTPHET